MSDDTQVEAMVPVTDIIEDGLAESIKEDKPVNSESLNDDGLDRKTLFVRSIPFDATSEDLSEYFSQFVPVKHAVIVLDDQKKSRGFGFVSFTMDEDTVTALQESKKAKFKNRLLRVDVAKRRDRKPKDGSQPAPVASFSKQDSKSMDPVEKRRARLIVRNLPWSCKKPEELKKLFSQYGAVFDAYIPKKKGGKMCGFAFVIMKKVAAAERAVKGSVGLKIDGREVAVDLALEKSKWEDIKDQEPEDAGGDDVTEHKDNDKEGNDQDGEGNDQDVDFEKLNEINTDDEVEDGQDEIILDAEPEPERPKSNRQEAYSIFVRNIPYDADAETLKEHFEKFGPVKYALPVMDRETGLARGSAFVAFKGEEAYDECLKNAPTSDTTSMLIADDVSPAYVYQGRILSITAAVDRSSADRLAERNSLQRKDALGKGPGASDKRNLFLLNEGRITTNSKLAQFISKTDLEMREKSFKLRVQQLNKNPSLHLSFTRLAIRNLPRAMNPKALKALGRKAVVQFATEVKEEKRQPLSKEELNRSIKHKHETNEFLKKGDEDSKKKNKLMGVVKQAKVVLEVKGLGETGRSRGYGFIEFRDHKSALMGLRWLNAHEVSLEEITDGLSEEEQKIAKLEGLSKRRLIAEFAIENAEVVKRRRDRVFIARNPSSTDDKDSKNKKRKRGKDEDDAGPSAKKGRKGSLKKGNMNKGGQKPESPKDSGLSDDTKKLIGIKRKRRKNKA